jgi:hypothetical protein
LTLRIADLDLDKDDERNLEAKSDLGFYVSIGQNLQDVLMLSNMRSGDPSAQPQSQARLIIQPESEERILIVVKTVEKGLDTTRDEYKVGSVSIP